MYEPQTPELEALPPALTDEMMIEGAHETMRDHVNCATDSCRHRQRALEILVTAGRNVLPE